MRYCTGLVNASHLHPPLRLDVAVGHHGVELEQLVHEQLRHLHHVVLRELLPLAHRRVQRRHLPIRAANQILFRIRGEPLRQATVGWSTLPCSVRSALGTMGSEKDAILGWMDIDTCR